MCSAPRIHNPYREFSQSRPNYPYSMPPIARCTRRRTERRALRMNRRSGPGRQWGSASSRIVRSMLGLP